MNTLLHICCAPCANQCIDVLRSDHYDVTGFWYNPNIHPFTEYRTRRNCLRDYAQAIELPLIERNDYGLRPFVRAVADDIENRRREALTASLPPCSSPPIRSTTSCGRWQSEPPANTAWNSCTGISDLISGQARNGPESLGFISRNTAAASFPRKSAI